MMSGQMREVRLPADLCQAAEQRYGSRFGSLEEILAFVLQEITRDEAAQMDRAEQQIIEQRLKDLGYI
jgi:hypothetical protein